MKYYCVYQNLKAYKESGTGQAINDPDKQVL